MLALRICWSGWCATHRARLARRLTPLCGCLQELEAKRLIPPSQHFYKKAVASGGNVGGGGGAMSGWGGGLVLGNGGHREAQEQIAVPKGFLHVYDLPPKFNEEIKELPTQWHPEQYDIDQVRLSWTRLSLDGIWGAAYFWKHEVARLGFQRTATPSGELVGFLKVCFQHTIC